MYKTVIKDSELAKWRNIREMKEFIESIFSRIRDVYDKERANYQLSKGNYKNLTEECISIFNYLKNKYGLAEDVFYRHVGVGNQSYDGEIKKNNITTRIEIAYPLLGKEYKERQKELLDTGSYLYEYGEELIPKIRKVILETAEKKAKKPYGETLLLIYYTFSEYLYPGDTGLTEDSFGKLIKELKEISYKANKVDFFVPSYNDYLGKKNKPARLYEIK